MLYAYGFPREAYKRNRRCLLASMVFPELCDGNVMRMNEVKPQWSNGYDSSLSRMRSGFDSRLGRL